MKNLILIPLLLGSLSINAAEFYVRQNATGTQSGADWNNAYTSLPETLQRGATYYVADGTYPNFTANDAVSGTTRITIKKATIAAHGTGTGWDNSYGDGQAFIGRINAWKGYYTWDGATRNESDWLDLNSYGFRMTLDSGEGISMNANAYAPSAGIFAPGWEIKNFAFAGSVFNPGTHATPIYAVAPANANGWLISRVMFQDTANSLLTKDSHDWIYEYCAQNRSFGKEALRAQGTSARWIVRHSIFVDACIDGDESNTAEIGIFGWPGCDDWQIYGNIFHDTGAYPIHHNWGVIQGGGGYAGAPTVNRWKVYNNIFSNLGRGGNQGQIVVYLSGSGHQVHNNVWWNIPSWCNVGWSTGGVSAQNNWIHPSTANGASAMVASFPTTRIGVADPFVDWAARNYAPKDPATVANPDIVDNGAVLSGYANLDLFGNPWDSGSGWDIGAIAYGGVPPTTPPTITGPLTANATNLVQFNIQISANNASSYGISNAPSPGTMTVNGASGAISWMPNLAPGVYNMALLASNNVPAHAVTNLAITVYDPPPPQIVAVPAVLAPNGTNWSLVLTNLADLVTKTFVVSNAGPDGTTLNWTSVIAAPFFISGGVSNGLLLANQSTNITVGVRPSAVGQRDVPLRVSDTNGVIVTNICHVDGYAIFPTDAEFYLIHGLVFTNQSLGNWDTNGVANVLRYPLANNTAFGGPKAVYAFMLSEPTQFRIRGEVWPSCEINSAYIGVNTDPGMIQDPPLNSFTWEVLPVTNGIESAQAAWDAGELWFTVHIRGNGSPTLACNNYAPEFTNAVFTGVTGTNFIYLYSKSGEADMWFRRMEVELVGAPASQPPPPPSNLQPANGLHNVNPTTVTLSWTMGTGAISNEVWWTLDPMQYNLMSEQTTSTFDLFQEQAHYLTTNYWYVVNWNEFGRATSAFASFVTQSAPPPENPDSPIAGPLRRPPRNSTRLVTPTLSP